MITRITGLMLAVLLAAGCSADDAEPAAAGRTASGTAPATPNDLARNSAHRTLQVPGEPFVLTVDYYLTAYDATRWRTPAAKDVTVSAYVRPAGRTAVPAVLLGSFQVRAELRSLDPGLDALPVSTMDDRPTAAVAGYAVSAAYPYTAVVPVNGFGPALVDRWSFLAGGQQLTEEGLVKAGVYANRLVFSYGLLVRGPGGYHKRTVTDALTVPVTTA